MATLGFSTKFPWGEETHFVPKIWKGLKEYNLFPQWASLPYLLLAEQKNLDYLFKKDTPPKIHTIREDKADLWKPGRKIHPVVFNRTKNRFQFAPVLECKSVQDIEIKYVRPCCGGIKINGVFKSLFGSNFSDDTDFLNRLIQNDGFDSVGDFFRFFSKDFTGKIIHWTDFKY